MISTVVRFACQDILVPNDRYRGQRSLDTVLAFKRSRTPEGCLTRAFLPLSDRLRKSGRVKSLCCSIFSTFAPLELPGYFHPRQGRRDITTPDSRSLPGRFGRVVGGLGRCISEESCPPFDAPFVAKRKRMISSTIKNNDRGVVLQTDCRSYQRLYFFLQLCDGAQAMKRKCYYIYVSVLFHCLCMSSTRSWYVQSAKSDTREIPYNHLLRRSTNSETFGGENKIVILEYICLWKAVNNGIPCGEATVSSATLWY